MANRHPIFTGKIFAATWQGDTPPANTAYYEIGLVTKGELGISDDVIKLPDTESVTGGTADSHRQIKEVTLKLTAQNFNPHNLAMALYGTTSVIPAQTRVERFTLTNNDELNVVLGLIPQAVEIYTENYVPASLTTGVLADHNQIKFLSKKGLPTKIALTQPSTAQLTTMVTVTGQTINVSLKYDGTAITATVDDVIAAIQASVSASELVTTEIVAGSNGTAIVAAAAEQSLAGQVGEYFSNPFDYTVRGGTIMVSSTSSIPLNTAICVKMTIAETVRFDGMTEISAPVSIVIEQTDAKTNKLMRLRMPKVQFSPLDKLAIFSEKAAFADLNLTGEVQKFTNVVSHELFNATTQVFENVNYGISQYLFFDMVQ
jgi:hypothetical protein